MANTTVITEPSICIPRTLNNITWRDVKDAFEQIIGNGTVERVDMIKDKNGAPFCKIFVHFRYWPTDENATQIRKRLLDGEMVKIVYDTPWFWKCSASRVPKPEREKTKKTAYIEYNNEKIKIYKEVEPPKVVRQNEINSCDESDA
tara:strand:+ start:41 stop:478 length:438 start_codon:yes stop_codon:yes gene_type:complete